MLGFRCSRHYLSALPAVLFVAAAPLLSAGVIYQLPLPTTNLNSGAGASRSDASVIQGSFSGAPPTPYIVGNDFLLSNTQGYIINSLTVYAIGSSPTTSLETLGAELNSVSLLTGVYTGSLAGSPLSPVATLTNAQLAAAPRVQYNGTTDYESLNTAGTFYPLWQLTFTGLNWYVPAGQIDFFGVSGSPIGGNTFNISASTDPDANTYDPFWFYTGTPFVPTYQDCIPGSPAGCPASSINNFNQLAVVNVSLDGSAVPEPSTLGLLGLGIAGFVLKLRRRK